MKFENGTVYLNPTSFLNFSHKKRLPVKAAF